MVMTTVSERLAGPAPDLEWLSAVAGDAYAAAARANAPVRDLVDLVEPVRERAAATADPYALGRSFDAAVTRSVGSPLQPMVTSLRGGYYRWLVDELKAQCLRAFADNLHAGRSLWLRRYGQAMANSRLKVCDALTARAWLPDEVEQWRDELSEATRRAHRSEWHLALPVLERLLDDADTPPDEQVLLLAMASRLTLGWLADSAAAERYAGRAFAISPDTPSVVAARAFLRMWQGDQKQADQMLEDSLAQHPDDAACQTYYALSALWYDLPEVTEARARKGLHHAPDESGLYQMLMSAYAAPALFKDRKTQLQHVADQRIALDADDAYDTEVDLGVAFRDNGDTDGARDHLQTAVDLDPTRVRALGEMARLLAKENRFDRATAELDRALAIDPHSSDTLQIAAEISDQQGNSVEAERCLLLAAEAGSGNPGSLWAALAERQVSAGRLETAWATAGRAVAAAPELRTCLYLTESAAAQWRTDPDSVRRLFGSVLTDGDRDRAELHSLLADAAYAAEDYESAAAGYAAAAELSPERGWYRRNQAGALRELGRWAEASECIVAAFELDSEVAARDSAMANLHNVHANRCYEAGGYAEAEALYRAATQERPEDAVFWSNLSLALEETVPGRARADRLREAADALVRAAELAPGDGTYGVRLARLRTVLGRLDRFGPLIETAAELPSIRVELADDLVPMVDPEQLGRPFFDERLPAMRDRLAARLGFEVPGVRFRPATLSPGEFRVQFLGVTRSSGRVTSQSPHEASGQLVAAVEEAIVAHAGLLFGVDAATVWWRAHLNDERSHTRPQAKRASRRQHRLATTRLLAAARALRACVADGILLDQQVADLVAASLDEQLGDRGGVDADHMSLAAAATEAVRRDRRRASPPAFPAWAVEVAATGRPLTAVEEHRLHLELAEAGESPREALHEAPWPADGYLGRLAEEAE